VVLVRLGVPGSAQEYASQAPCEMEAQEWLATVGVCMCVYMFACVRVCPCCTRAVYVLAAREHLCIRSIPYIHMITCAYGLYPTFTRLRLFRARALPPSCSFSLALSHTHSLSLARARSFFLCIFLYSCSFLSVSLSFSCSLCHTHIQKHMNTHVHAHPCPPPPPPPHTPTHMHRDRERQRLKERIDAGSKDDARHSRGHSQIHSHTHMHTHARTQLDQHAMAEAAADIRTL